MSNQKKTQSAAQTKEPSVIEVAETFSASLKELRESVNQRLELLETKFLGEIEKVTDDLSSVSVQSKLPEVENFIRSAKIAGELNRAEIFKMVFTSVLSGVCSVPTSNLYKFSNTESGIQNREHEVNKILAITDTFMEALEEYFAPEG